MHSPDRRYWWDGSEWKLAVSPDGRLWFDGTAWQPNPLAPPGLPPVPTRWTRPLQAAVITVALLGFAMVVAAVPAFVSVMPAPTVVVAPSGTTPEDAARFAREARPMMIGSFVVMAILAGAVAAGIVIAAVKRWRWAFWVIVVLLGLNAFNLVVPLLLGAAGLLPAPPGPPPRQPAPLPAAVGILGSLVLPASIVLFVGMLVAGVRVGSWACRRPAEEPPHSPRQRPEPADFG